MRVEDPPRDPNETRDPLGKGATPMRRTPGDPPRPVYYRIDLARRIIRILPDHWEEFEDLLATIPDLPHHPRFSFAFGKMWDLSQLDWDPTEDQVKALFEASHPLPRHPHAGKNAIVLELGIWVNVRARYPQYIRNKVGRVNRCFPSYFEAEIWLLAPLFTPDTRGTIHIPPEIAADPWNV